MQGNYGLQFSKTILKLSRNSCPAKCLQLRSAPILLHSILRHCLTHEEDEIVLNDFHAGACGDHLSRLAIAQKILCAGYFWPSIFKDCIETVKKIPLCQNFTTKKHTRPTLLHPILTVGPFAKWGIDFMHCRPTSTEGHNYIIATVDYFTKWAEAMPTYAKDGKQTLFIII